MPDSVVVQEWEESVQAGLSISEPQFPRELVPVTYESEYAQQLFVWLYSFPSTVTVRVPPGSVQILPALDRADFLSKPQLSVQVVCGTHTFVPVR